MQRIRGILLSISFIAFSMTSVSFAFQKPASGETEIHGYLEFLFVDDRGIGWSGSETTFLSRLKLDLLHGIHDDVLVRFRGEYEPTVHSYSRAYEQMSEREGNLEDTYIQFTGLPARGTALRLGVVKVPFGHFDTFALEERNRPLSMARTREWDFGMRLDATLSFMDFTLAAVNGEGRTGTDANSSKSVVMNLSFPAGEAGEIYQETLQITNYPNPRKANPGAGFLWKLGLSGYVGNRYTTPIKEKNNHYGIDFKFDYSIFSLKGQAVYLEGYYTNASVAEADFNELEDAFLYGPDVSPTPDTFPESYAWFVELTAGFTEKVMAGLMYEYYDPDMESGTGVLHVARERAVLGIKYDYSEGVSVAIFYTINNDPAFGQSGNILQSDDWKGDNVFMAAVAAQF